MREYAYSRFCPCCGREVRVYRVRRRKPEWLRRRFEPKQRPCIVAPYFRRLMLDEFFRSYRLVVGDGRSTSGTVAWPRLEPLP